MARGLCRTRRAYVFCETAPAKADPFPATPTSPSASCSIEVGNQASRRNRSIVTCLHAQQDSSMP